MNLDITITIKPDQEKNTKLLNKLISAEVRKNNIAIEPSKIIYRLVKKSIDARHGTQKIHLKYKIFIDEDPNSFTSVPLWKPVSSPFSVIIIGAGPAGLFGALKLLEFGIKPIIIERGSDTTQRRKDIALISTQQIVNNDSNYCFGEGGAGTFSDGKLYTRSNKRGNIENILRIFANFGADKKILTDAHPHIGTDKLPLVINNIRNKILELGGEIHFNTKLIDFITTKNSNNEIEIKGVITESVNGGQRKSEKTFDNSSEKLSAHSCTTNHQEKNSSLRNSIYADAILLATGHSASDIYYLIAKTNPNALEAKTFAAGVRVEHPRQLINAIQYHGNLDPSLPTAEYRVTTQVGDRGVYSFCMCPGGFVVPSASGTEEIVVNGMSTAARNSKWSNAAIVVEIRPEDIPSEFTTEAKQLSCPQLAGLLFRTYMEKTAKSNGEGQRAPAQRLTDFLAHKLSDSLPQSSYTPGLISSDLNQWLPAHISERLHQGFKNIDKNMQGFISEQAVMIAIETRTSTPVRITRDRDTFESSTIKNLYPAGEGSGYSGGIVSSAMDGENACLSIAKKLLKI